MSSLNKFKNKINDLYLVAGNQHKPRHKGAKKGKQKPVDKNHPLLLFCHTCSAKIDQILTIPGRIVPKPDQVKLYISQFVVGLNWRFGQGIESGQIVCFCPSCVKIQQDKLLLTSPANPNVSLLRGSLSALVGVMPFDDRVSEAILEATDNILDTSESIISVAESIADNGAV